MSLSCRRVNTDNLLPIVRLAQGLDGLPGQQHTFHVWAVRRPISIMIYTAMLMTIIRTRVSADENSVSNQTNLALKGIVAIKAMSQLSSALGQGADADTYSVSFPIPVC